MKYDMEHWYASAFDEDYLHRYAHRNEDEAREAVKLVLANAPMPPQPRVFDLACGAGRHLLVLKACKLDAFGGDLSEPLLREAAEAGLRVLRLDMRALPLADESVHLVTNFFTAFGYFEDDAENFRVLDEVARVLRAGGWFLLDFLNAETAIDQIKATPREELTTPDGRRWCVERQVSPDGLRAEKVQRELQEGEVVREIHERVRLFAPDELRRALKLAGFRVQHEWGGYRGERYEAASSSRYIVLARKI